MSLATVSWVDWACLAVLAVSAFVGLVRGLVFEVLSVLGWIAAYVAAQALSPAAALAIPVGSPGSGLNAAAAFVAVFIATLIGWSVLSWLICKLVQASPLNPLDRVLGGLFGLLRGLLIGLAAATAVGMTPLADAPAWRGSRSAGVLERVLAGLKPLLPDAIGRHLRAVGSESPRDA